MRRVVVAVLRRVAPSVRRFRSLVSRSASQPQTIEPGTQPISWPGGPLSPALRMILVELSAPPARASDQALVGYISHPLGAIEVDWRLDLFPNTVVPILEMVRTDVLVIDASAALAGSPWAGAGSEIDPKRTWDLVEAIRTCRRLEIPTVFRWDVPTHRVPMLRRVAERCDVVVAAEPGLGSDQLPLLPHQDAAGDEALQLGRLTGVSKLAGIGGGGS